MVFIGVELLVRFVIEPLASKKKNKLAKTYIPRFDPTIRLASETMYDGGEIHKDGKPIDANDENSTSDSNSNKNN